jgi:chaperonin GroEL
MKLIGANNNSFMSKMGMGSSRVNVFEVEKEIQNLLTNVEISLEKKSIPVEDYETLKQIATISANNDKYLGEMVSKLVWDVGESGSVQVLPSKFGADKIEKKSGYVLDIHPITPEFLRGQKKVVLPNPGIMIVDEDIEDFDHLASAIGYWKSVPENKSRPVLLLCGNLSGSALSSVLKNINTMGVFAVRCPASGEMRSHLLEDVISGTLTKVKYGKLHGSPLRQFKDYGIDQLGSAANVEISRDQTIITFNEGDVIKESIEKRIAYLTEERDSVEGQAKTTAERRISALQGGIGVLHIYADSDTELNAKIQLVDDAQRSCFTALKTGFVSGGGLALYEMGHCLINLNVPRFDDREVVIAMKALGAALMAPMRCILSNRFGNNVSKIASIEKSIVDSDFTKVYDVKAGELVDPSEAGLIDACGIPGAVVRNAISVASQILTSKHFIFVEQ